MASSQDFAPRLRGKGPTPLVGSSPPWDDRLVVGASLVVARAGVAARPSACSSVPSCHGLAAPRPLVARATCRVGAQRCTTGEWSRPPSRRAGPAPQAATTRRTVCRRQRRTPPSMWSGRPTCALDGCVTLRLAAGAARGPGGWGAVPRRPSACLLFSVERAPSDGALSPPPPSMRTSWARAASRLCTCPPPRPGPLATARAGSGLTPRPASPWPWAPVDQVPRL